MTKEQPLDEILGGVNPSGNKFKRFVSNYKREIIMFSGGLAIASLAGLSWWGISNVVDAYQNKPQETVVAEVLPTETIPYIENTPVPTIESIVEETEETPSEPEPTSGLEETIAPTDIPEQDYTPASPAQPTSTSQEIIIPTAIPGVQDTPTNTPEPTSTNTPIPQPPNLAITSLNVTSFTESGASFDITYANNGGTTIDFNGVVLKAFVSANSSFDGESTDPWCYMREWTSMTLPPGQSRSESLSCTRSGMDAYMPGMSYLLASIDYTDMIAESNENDNWASDYGGVVATNTPEPTPTPAVQVYSASISANPSSIHTGSCPYPFEVYLRLEYSGTGNISREVYICDASGGNCNKMLDGGYSVYAGSSITYLNDRITGFSGNISWDGLMYVQITEPNSLKSNNLSIDINCTE